MKERPQSVTIICWILIGMNALAVLSTIAGIAMTNAKPEFRKIMEQSPVPIPVQYAITFAGIAVTLSSAIAMLNGRNWGRWLYVIWTIATIIFALATSPLKLFIIPGFLVFVLIMVFLFRPAANKYFSATEGGHGPEGV